MHTHADKTSEDKSSAAANSSPKIQGSGESTFQFVDNRPEFIARRKSKEAINNNHGVQQLKTYKKAAANSSTLQNKPVQKKENNTGLPDNLKAGIENLANYSMDDVRVHYNSDKPAQLSAHAYAQGTNIHLAPGQEKHLPHEAWHVVQQKQGRVKPSKQMKGVNINDDQGLEQEADLMGRIAQRVKFNQHSLSNSNNSIHSLQLKLSDSVKVLQMVVDDTEWRELYSSFSIDFPFLDSLKAYLISKGYPNNNLGIKRSLASATQEIREHVKTQWQGHLSRQSPALEVNTEAKAAHDIVRMVLGIPLNATIQEVAGKQAYSAKAGIQANNLRNEIAGRMRIDDSVKNSKDKKEKEIWMIKNAALGVTLGGGVCNDFGALSAILLHLGAVEKVKYVGTDSHNWATYAGKDPHNRGAYDRDHLLDPWKNYQHKEEVSSPAGRDIVDLSQLNRAWVFKEFITFKAEAEHYWNEIIRNDIFGKLDDYLYSPEFQRNKYLGNLMTELIPRYLPIR